MKKFLKENSIQLLFLALLSLLFIFWGRVILREIQFNSHTQNLNTLEARLLCLKSFGWEVDPGSETERTVSIPAPLDAVYIKYNKLQTPSGFNLERYQGKSATCYTYRTLNFPYETPEPVFVNLLIYEGTLIAGDCMTTALDGFMLPLDRKFLHQ